MIIRDLHVHTTYSDGKDSPEEVVLSAIEKGISTIGFSDHSYTHFDESYCMGKERVEEYIKEINALKEKYRGKIEILCGIEQDFYSDYPTDRFDFVIGSVHYFKFGDTYVSVDESKKILENAAKEFCGGDIYILIEEYYKCVAKVAKKTKADIIGHFDLITKFNENGEIFDTKHPRYIKAVQAAADELITANIPFEINTGAISRGYRTTPYPEDSIIEYIKSKGGRFILASDSHSADTVAFGFRDFYERAN